MANLKEIRDRITSISSTKQITSAMKMVSAAKLRKAQESVQQMRPYAKQLQIILSYLSDVIRDEEDDPFGVHREVERVLVVMITSNRGLCGGFNSSVIKNTIQFVNEDFGNLLRQKNVDFYAIGNVVPNTLVKTNFSWLVIAAIFLMI